MARSARTTSRAAIAVLTACLTAAVASGCGFTTTQQKDAWLGVKAERTLVKPQNIKIGKPDPDIEVTGTSIVRGDKETAITVGVKNTSEHPVNDLPIAVGIKGDNTDGGYLNLTKGVKYFESHIPALAAGEAKTWVFVSKHDVPDGEPFAEVGERATPPLTVAESLPGLEVTQTGTSSTKAGGTVELEVSNVSGVPQYDVEIYATASKGGNVVAAGTASLDELEGGHSDSVKLALVGDPKDATVDVFAPPTIFK